MKEQFLEKIIELHSEYSEFDTLFAQQEKKLTQARAALEASTGTSSVEEAKKLDADYYIDLALFSQDLQIRYARLGNYIDLYVELFQEIPDQVKEFYKVYKIVFPKYAFILKDGNLVESEEGALEAKRKAFLEGDFYKNIEKLMG